jgi:hypothetical protein
VELFVNVNRENVNIAYAVSVLVVVAVSVLCPSVATRSSMNDDFG